MLSRARVAAKNKSVNNGEKVGGDDSIGRLYSQCNEDDGAFLLSEYFGPLNNLCTVYLFN